MIARVLNSIWDFPLIRQLKGATQEAAVRGIRVLIGSVMAVLVTNAAAGTLVPAGWGQGVAIIIASLVLAADKWFRARDLEATPAQ